MTWRRPSRSVSRFGGPGACLWTTACACTCSCGPAAEDGHVPRTCTGSQSSAIVGGTVDEGDPWAVAILEEGRGTFCAGALIAPRIVLTAAHCVPASGDGRARSAVFGTQVSDPAFSIDVVEERRHPLYSGGAHDLAVLHLARDVTEVPAAELSLVALSDADVGRMVRHVGFGSTNPDGSGRGIKRSVSHPILRIEPFMLETGAEGKQTCIADSGAPALILGPEPTLERIAGVVSFGDDLCARRDFDARVDADADWIRESLGLGASAPPDGCERGERSRHLVGR